MSSLLPITWNYGRGVQSIGIAVLIAKGILPVPEFIGIADTGYEISTTWDYLDRYVQPMLADVGATVVRIQPSKPNKLIAENGTILIPAYTENGKLSTFCSGRWKRDVVQRHLRSIGYGPNNPVVSWFGFSVDEIGRLFADRVKWQHCEFPLVDMDGKYGTRMRRYQCQQLIIDFGLPPAPRSACTICPHRNNSEWRAVKENEQDWAQAQAADRFLTQHDLAQGHSGVYLHKDRVPLAQSNIEEPDSPQLALEGPSAECSAGSCWT
jgi:hypothetical protein